VVPGVYFIRWHATSGGAGARVVVAG
jgi:hypothetical protein